MDQEEQEYFEYSLNVPTVVKYHHNDSTVFYMDRAKWYQFKVKLDNEKMIAHLKKLYFRVQLDFVNENLRQNRQQLFKKWQDLHTGERLLDIDTNNLENGRVIYGQENANTVRLITDSAEEMQFSRRINCVATQFVVENQNLNSNEQSDFYLIFTVFSSDSSTVLDTNLCQIKTFWTGLAEPNFEVDRCRQMDNNPNVVCEQKYKLLETILNTNSNEINEQEDENVLESSVAPKNRIHSSKRNKFFTYDNREFVCIFHAPENDGETSLERGKEYILSIEPLNFARPGEKIQVCIGLQFAQSDIELAQILSNWSLRNQRKTLIEYNLDLSQLENSVFDIYQENLYSISLIWIPEEEIKLSLQFNFDSSDFDDLNIFPKFVVETSLQSPKCKIEKSTCLITVSETGESEVSDADVENDSSVTILSNQSFSQNRKTLTKTETIETKDEGIQVNQDESFAKMLISIENVKFHQKTWTFLAIALAIISACLIKQTQFEVGNVFKTNLDTLETNQEPADSVLVKIQNDMKTNLKSIENNQKKSDQILSQFATEFKQNLKAIEDNQKKSDLFSSQFASEFKTNLKDIEDNQKRSDSILTQIETNVQFLKTGLLIKNILTIKSLKLVGKENELSSPVKINLYKLTEDEFKSQIVELIHKYYPNYALKHLKIYLKDVYQLVNNEIVKNLPTYSKFRCYFHDTGNVYLYISP